MLDKFSSMGVEAVEIGAGGYTGTPQCPVPELIANPQKALALRSTFTDLGISIMAITCHGNAIHPDQEKAGAFALQFRQAVPAGRVCQVCRRHRASGCGLDTRTGWAKIFWVPGQAVPSAPGLDGRCSIGPQHNIFEPKNSS
jgi:sugar phosphate isomerase/epimerase